MKPLSYQFITDVLVTNGRHAHELSRPLQRAMQTYPAARQEEDRMSQQPSVDFRIGNFKFRCTRTQPASRRRKEAKLRFGDRSAKKNMSTVTD